MTRLTLALCPLLAGCLWIGDADHEERLDLDGDGVRYDLDCDDQDGEIGAPAVWFVDGDGDGFGGSESVEACEPPSGAVEQGGDCDDADSAVHPQAEEVCDGADNDCDALVDDDDDGLVGGDDWYPDSDGDGFGDSSVDPVQACEQPADHTGVDDATDCDDDDSSVYPGAPEYCDEIDHDCDGESWDDDAVDVGTWYLDGDGDGYGVDDDTTSACEQPSGYAAEAGDCDDGDAAFNPGAVEDDCADPNDYNCDGSTGYADNDGDGYAACEDCDDSDASVSPGALEYCDGADNDCDGDTDEDDAADAGIWYLDADLDGYGDAASSTTACEQPSGYLATAEDCDDAEAAINPAASEICNDSDDDCDGLLDEDDPDLLDGDVWFMDLDGDGYGDASDSGTLSCDLPSGMVHDSTDCDDSDASVNPGADELPGDACFDGVDNDCDGDADSDAASCASCPWGCGLETCLWVDGVLQATQSSALNAAMASVDTVVLRHAGFDELLVGIGGAVVVAEDFESDLGCFTTGTLGTGSLDAGKAAACSFGDADLSGGDWMVSVEVLAGSTDAFLALVDTLDLGSHWTGWGSAPLLDDGEGNTVPFTDGAPDQGSDHQVVMCGMVP
jgi:hypothetical protein